MKSINYFAIKPEFKFDLRFEINKQAKCLFIWSENSSLDLLIFSNKINSSFFSNLKSGKEVNKTVIDWIGQVHRCKLTHLMRALELNKKTLEPSHNKDQPFLNFEFNQAKWMAG